MPNTPDDVARKRLNVPRKRALAAGAARHFVNQYERKAQKGVEPNDRNYDRKTEQAVKRMKPERLDQVLREDEE